MGERRYLRDSLDEGRAVFGARATTLSPAVVELYGAVGLDFAWLDLEHTGASPLDSRVLEGLARAGDAAGIDPLVRLPSGEPAVVRKALGTGIRSILVPRVDSASEIRRAVEASRFVYDGRPGGYGASAGRDGVWGTDPPADPSDHDESVAVGCMVESRAAVENLTEILAVPDLDFAFVGPADLSVSLGHPLEKSHPEVQEAVATVRDAFLDADVPLGWVTNDVEDAETAVEQGYQLLRIGDEMGAARDVLASRLDALRSD